MMAHYDDEALVALVDAASGDYLTLYADFSGADGGFEEFRALSADFVPHPEINIVKETDATFRQVAIKGGHALSIESWQSWINDPFYHLTFLFNSKSKFTNLSFYNNPQMDKLIDDNMHEASADKRAAASRDAQKILLDDAVWGLLWYESWARVGSADLTGLEKRWDTFERYFNLKRT